MTNKTGWITEADVIIGFESLSANEKEYRLSQKVWLDPALDTLRQANRKAVITYIVSIAGNKYAFYHAKDAFCFAPVSDRAYCSYVYFVGELDAGRVWESGDVSVWINKPKEV